MTERASSKEASAFRTIGELSRDTGLPQHILRYWETRFPQLRPVQRAGNRRYYRPADIALVKRIDDLLNRQGYTVRGVQQVLEAPADKTPIEEAPDAASPDAGKANDASLTADLTAIRQALADALAQDADAAAS